MASPQPSGSFRGLTASKAVKNNVVLRIAYVSEREGKLFIAGPRLALALALGVLIWEFYVKLKDDPNLLLKDNTYPAVCAPLAALCVAAILATLGLLCKRLLWSRANGWRWTSKQRASVTFTTVALCLQLVGASSFLFNMIWIWVRLCSWFDTPVSVMAGLQDITLSTLFLLNIAQASRLLPEGAWGSLLQELRGRLGRKGGKGKGASSGAALKAGGSADEPAGLPSTDDEDAGATHHLLERVAHWGVPLLALLLLWVPTQAVIGLLMDETINNSQSGWEGWYCADLYDPACWPTKGWKCDNIYNAACWPTPDTCREWDWQCKPDSRVTNVTWALGAMMNIMSLAFLLLMWLALHQLGQRAYYEYRIQNLAARLALRTRVPTYVLYTINLLFCWYIRLGTCTSYLTTWIAMTATVVVESLLFMPSLPDEGATKLHDSLQQFAWTERGVAPLVRRRGFPAEPCFCFETALKAAYAALHVYRHFRPDSTETSISTALALFGATHYEWLREPRHDSNCLLMWGPRCLVIAFRGTSSAANIKADLKAWRTPHPPKRGSFWLGEMPLCHLGFVLGRIREILEGRPHSGMEAGPATIDRCCGSDDDSGAAGCGGGVVEEDGTGGAARPAAVKGEAPFRILLAGHSLGGAMSHLCGIDLARALPGWGFQVAPAALPLSEAAAEAGPTVSLSTYTFGAPRTGNRAFAKDYAAHMPDCWSIINGQDAVANQAKFLVLFKRPGKPVLLSRRGDLIVRPSTLEHTAHRTSGTSLKQHMLFGSYCPSLAAALRAQLTNKPMPGGQEALEHLRESEAMVQLLERMLGLAGPDGTMDKPLDSSDKLEAVKSDELEVD
ncbi:hypothetical protein CHLNCDRAFT_138469 [Chlorella variabilis]|uniref:Fungal lipase-type domain-containing protein n=1 Tax=Chlorella variabilis TaxID=554065 RepID=E1ZN44_CHLVA|nr:hypothetical protein CHLNCDRAFT_138469 [Chlorella variabilis]EFN52808.1 hypothetical protein CHLNCDRAFT_138469 [Chlorella variabilis]|eukprot:XP_005844910.1 hypothetical protein CHLNCDRAFT_138469 [Chlorella variabilis]